MNFIIKTTPEELIRARKWWIDLEMQWKMAYNEAVFGKGPTIETPSDDEMMILLTQANSLRFAGPLAQQSNVTTQLTNLSGLIPLYQLTYLSITHMRIRSLHELGRFTKMEHLFLYNNEIGSLKGIEKMFSLKDLYVQHNIISDLRPLKKLTNLETIYVSNNRIESINGLTSKHGKRLKKFYIQPNDDLLDKEIIDFQNKVGIICRTG